MRVSTSLPIFQPFSLSLTFESPAEAQEFYHRLNISPEAVVRAISPNRSCPTEWDGEFRLMDIWKAIRDEMKHRYINP